MRATPYIKPERRSAIQVLGETPTTPGELNFAITVLLLRYMRLKGKSYGTFNDILGALDAAAREFYRRVVENYEEEKRAQNGDVFD